jgi:hypothetical protein
MRLITTIPAESQGVIVQYSPNWRVSAVLGPMKRTLQTPYGDAQLDIPPMLITHTLAPNILKAKTYYGKPMEGHNFHVMMCEPGEAGKLMARAWPIGSHTGHNGTICWGRNPHEKDLRLAMNQFWSSIFSHQIKNPMDWAATFKWKGFNTIRDVTRRVLGDMHVVAPQRPDIVFISSEQADIALAPHAVIDGASKPADDFLYYQSGGFGADDHVPHGPVDGEGEGASPRPEIKAHEMGKILLGLGTRQPDGTYTIDVRGASLSYSPISGSLSLIAAEQAQKDLVGTCPG